MVKNVYIHIPFCKSKCRYCSFVSFTNTELKAAYLEALKKEIKNDYKNEKLNTLYIGGGTPSLLSPIEIKDLVDLFNINDKTEVTTELNPETINQEYLKDLQKTGVNRLSFGCQTFNDNILQIIGRRHNSKDVENAVKYARNAEFLQP